MRFDLDLPAWKWPFYIMRHPFEGYEDLRWKKAYNMPSALIIVALFFIVAVFEVLTTGFLHNYQAVKIFNVVPVIIRTVILFFTWVVANWSFCTLLDGEGNMRRIAIYSAYALVPYIICSILSTTMSYFVTLNESIWVTTISQVGLWWSVVLMVMGMKACHQYSFTKTFVCMILTVVGMLLILCLLVLIMSLFQQVWLFFFTIYTEIMYRVRS